MTGKVSIIKIYTRSLLEALSYQYDLVFDNLTLLIILVCEDEFVSNGRLGMLGGEVAKDIVLSFWGIFSLEGCEPFNVAIRELV